MSPEARAATTVESAIPAHLRVERSRPRRVPDDYVPPIPAVVSRLRPSVRQVVMAYLGAQFTGDVPPAGALAELDSALAGPDGPQHVDRARESHAGRTDLVSIGYWDDPAAFDRWFDKHRAVWLAEDQVSDGTGRWAEVIRPTVEQHETIFSAPGQPEGVATLGDGWSGPIQEHMYWGSMRDRLPSAQTDELLGRDTPGIERSGSRVRVRPGDALCLIRSGQEWTDTEGADRETYLRDVEPVLRAGMDYLRESGREIGCYANRYFTVLRNGKPADHTFGMSWWRSLDALERWAESHPTHVAIFGSALRYYSEVGPTAKLRLYHEVSVVNPAEQYFEYLGCAPGTGLLGSRP